MFSTEKLESLAKEIMSRLSGQDDENCDSKKDNKTHKTNNAAITPSKALVIAGLIGGVLEVDSLLVDRNQGSRLFSLVR